MVQCENFKVKSVKGIKVKSTINNAKDTDDIFKKEIDLIRKTYYIELTQSDWIDSMAYFEKMDKSEIVRKALENYIPEKYKKTIK